MGPTGSGKSTVAERVADELDAQLINADAFQVYRGFSIGTNKPTDRSRYAMIDIRDPKEGFGVGAWISLVLPLLEDLYRQGRSAVIVGGTGFYVRALLEEFQDLRTAPPADLRMELMRREKQDGLESLVRELERRSPATAAQTDLQNPVRVRRSLERVLSSTEPLNVQIPSFSRYKFGLDWDPAELDVLLNERVQEMLRSGWREEVSLILRQGTPLEAPAFRAIGYLTVSRLISGQINEREAVEEIWRLTRQYAKRQRTWLRSEPRLVSIGMSGGVEAAVHEAVLRVIECIRNTGNKANGKSNQSSGHVPEPSSEGGDHSHDLPHGGRTA